MGELGLRHRPPTFLSTALTSLVVTKLCLTFFEGTRVRGKGCYSPATSLQASSRLPLKESLYSGSAHIRQGWLPCQPQTLSSVPPAAGSASPQWGHKKTTATRKRERCEKSSEGCRVFGDGASHRVTGLLWSLDPVGYRHTKLFFFFNHYPQPGNRLGASPCQNSQVEEACQPYR